MNSYDFLIEYTSRIACTPQNATLNLEFRKNKLFIIDFIFQVPNLNSEGNTIDGF